MDEDVSRKIEKNPYNDANAVSKITFWWMIELVRKLLKSPTDVVQNYDSVYCCKTAEQKLILSTQWNNGDKERKQRPRLLTVLIRTFGKEFIFPWICSAFKFGVLNISQPFILYLLQDAMCSQKHIKESGNISNSFLYVFGLVCTSIIGSICFHYSNFQTQVVGMRVRVACCSLVHRKTLQLSKPHSGQNTIGQFFNIISSDVFKFDQVTACILPPLVSPLSLAINAAVLILLVGNSALPALACFTLLAVINLLQGRIFKRIRQKKSIITDKKLQQTNSAISEMTTIKMFSWEKPFGDVIKSTRNLELKLQRSLILLRSINITNVFLTDKLSMFILIVCGIAWKDDISPHIFVAAIIFANLKLELFQILPLIIEFGADCLVAINRIENVLNIKEKEFPIVGNKSETIKPHLLLLENVSATWNTVPNCFAISGINLTLNESELCIITGPVGSGKTTLLMTILGEALVTNGSIISRGNFGFVSQEPWLFPSTIRNNILFGRPFDTTLYLMVIYSCMLHEDFREIRNGDGAYVGEKGIALSGGQKSRINLARSLYLNSDIYLIDDPLSAVDANVQQHILRTCILGFIKQKVRLLVTHQTRLISGIKSKVIIMDKGRIIKTTLHPGTMESKEVPLSDTSFSLPAVMPECVPVSFIDKNTKLCEKRDSDAKKYSVYKLYGYAVFGYLFAPLFVILALASQLSVVAFNIALAMWSSETHFKKEYTYVNLKESNALIGPLHSEATSSNDVMFILAFGVIVILIVVLTMACSFIFYYCCIQASAKFHDGMLDGVFRTNVSFFVKNPTGMILNRFSRDMEIVDDVLPFSLLVGITRILPVLTMIIEVGYSSYILIFPVTVLFLLTIIFCCVYLKTSKPLKQSEASTRSPVFSYFNSSLRGTALIKVHSNQELVQKEFDRHQDAHSVMYFFYVSLTRWFAMWMEILVGVFAAIEIFIILGMQDDYLNTRIGLVLYSIISVATGMQFAIRLIAEADSQMVSVKRVHDYSQLPEESGYHIKEVPEKVPSDWPNIGGIEYENVSLFYNKEKHAVLKSVSFKVKAGEKIGIVGRTGAGKSSVISALFRIGQITGRILIDGVDIASLPLIYYRKKIAIVPQIPVLLSGTIRDNLDPFQQHSDEELWHALEHVELGDHVKGMKEELSSLVTEGATNFSMGQRQLLCMARIVLQNSKIVVLDEATSNLDPKNDAIVQKAIREKFSSCTVLVIAHLLDTIKDFDKIMVVDKGSIIEFGKPTLLLQNESGAFRKLVEQSKLHNETKME